MVAVTVGSGTVAEVVSDVGTEEVVSSFGLFAILKYADAQPEADP